MILEPPWLRVSYEHGWHIQLQFNCRDLPEHKDEDLFRPARHFRRSTISAASRRRFEVTEGDPTFKRPAATSSRPASCWVKLSAPYESSKSRAATTRTAADRGQAPWQGRTVPHRMLWASNWPHPGQKNPIRPDEANMLDMMLDWVDDEATRKRILVDNPAELYGF